MESKGMKARIIRYNEKLEEWGVDVGLDDLGTYVCSLCRGNDESSCDHEIDGYQCTREPGHSGPHAACGIHSYEHPIIEWEDSPIGDG